MDCTSQEELPENLDKKNKKTTNRIRSIVQITLWNHWLALCSDTIKILSWIFLVEIGWNRNDAAHKRINYHEQPISPSNCCYRKLYTWIYISSSLYKFKTEMIVQSYRTLYERELKARIRCLNWYSVENTCNI